jgi:Tfp pilus assembly protein PilX
MAADTKQHGFATPVALALVAVTGVLSIGALHDALFSEQLAGSRLLHQRAAALADLGIHDAMIRLGNAAAFEGELAYAPRGLPSDVDAVEVRIRHLHSSALPSGFSATRFATHQFEIESTGHAARGIRMTQVQGAVRVMPLPEEE